MLNDNHKRKSLGRGLGALLGEDLDILTTEAQAGDKIVSIENLNPSPYQPRSEFNEEALQALSESIAEKGVLQPLLVRELENGRYEIIAGERRYRASKMAGLHEVPVIIKNMDDQEVLEVALIENLLRENLSAIEEAEGLQRLIDEFSHTQEAVSKIVGKSRSYVANTLRLLSLPQSVQQMVRDNILTAGQVRPLIGLDNAESLAKKIAEKGLNARQVEDLAAKAKLPQEPKKKKSENSDLEELSQGIAQNLGVKVKISSAKNGSGKIVLQYNNLEDLDRLIDLLQRHN